MNREPEMLDNARRIFDARYPRKDEAGEPTETPGEAMGRVADNVASVNALYVEHPKRGEVDREHYDNLAPADFNFPERTAVRQYRWLARHGHELAPFEEQMTYGRDAAKRQAEVYRGLLTSLDFVPNSPTWTGAGTPLGQLAACFVLPIEDDLVTNRASIFETLRVAAAIQQTGGGNGFDFSGLRPSGALVRTSMGQASGPVGFMAMYDAAFGSVAQGGSRRGANMGVMRVDHPDIRRFIEAKTVEGKVANFNISVAVTDEFMERVDADDVFDLTFNGDVYDTIRARDLWDELVTNAHVIGDPGCLFIDRANRDNPVPQRYDLRATNPCGEQWLGPYENCCLGHINLANFVSEWEWGEVDFDWGALEDVVYYAVQFLDDVVDANQYVDPVPELEAAAQGGRRIGLGLMGLHDAMLMLGLRYDSEQGRSFASQVNEFVLYHAMLASIDRAKERGPFPWHEGSIYDSSDLAKYGPGTQMDDPVTSRSYRLWEPPKPLHGYYNTDEFDRPPLDWDEVTRGLIEHGLRNSTLMTWAPTGTTSNVAGLEGSGCEPLFALAYKRRVMQESEDIVLDYLSPLFAKALADAGLLTLDEREQVLEDVKANGGSCQGLDYLPESVRDTFVVAADIAPADHVKMQATLQAFTDNSISKTINLPNEATVEDVAEVYRLAFDLGCKGITVYRQGSRSLEVLSTERDEEQETTEDHWPLITPMQMPPEAEDAGLDAVVRKVRTPHGSMWATITEIAGHPGRPFDVRLTVGKAGNDKLADIEAIGRSVSLALRSGVDVKHVIEQLEGIGGRSFAGFGENRVHSAADGLAQALRDRYLNGNRVTITNGDVDTTRVCPDCKNTSLVFEDGCLHCETRLGGCGEFVGCD